MSKSVDVTSAKKVKKNNPRVFLNNARKIVNGEMDGMVFVMYWNKKENAYTCGVMAKQVDKVKAIRGLMQLTNTSIAELMVEEMKAMPAPKKSRKAAKKKKK